MRSGIAVSLACLGLALSGCKKTPDTPSSEFCKSAVHAATGNFPHFTLVEDPAKPSVGFEVCDSKVADLNGDGLLDFVAADHIGSGFGYFMRIPGEPIRFSQGTRVEFVHGANSAGIVVSDFNGDGIPDVANSDHPGAVTVRINATQPGAAIDQVSFPPEGETNVKLDVAHGHHFGFAGVEGGLIDADFNGDGKIDLATSNLGADSSGQSTASFILNTTEDRAPVASFTPPQYVVLPGPAISIDSADFNADGRPDVVTSNTGVSSISVLTNRTEQGQMEVSFDVLSLMIPAGSDPAGAGPTNPVAADFNNDGKPDVVTANWNVDSITLFTNDTPAGGATSFLPDPMIVELCFNPLVARAGDLDGDGDNDLVIVPLDLVNGLAVGVIENQIAPGSDVPALGLVELVKLPERMQPLDFLQWLDGKGDGRSPGTWFTSTGNAADLDGDGVLELLIAVAHGDFAIELRGKLTKTNSIVNFVEPHVSQHLANDFLPKHTELLRFNK